MTPAEYTGVPDSVPRGPRSGVFEQTFDLDELIRKAESGDVGAQGLLEGYRSQREFDMGSAVAKAHALTRGIFFVKDLQNILTFMRGQHEGIDDPTYLVGYQD